MRRATRTAFISYTHEMWFIPQLHLSAPARSRLQRLCGSVVCRKETLKGKLRKCHVDWRAENRRSTYEAELAGVGYKLERDEHARGLVAGRGRSWLQLVCGWEFRELGGQGADAVCMILVV